MFDESHERARLLWLPCALLATVTLASACEDSDTAAECTDPKLVGALELGHVGEDGEFIAITDGQAVPIVAMQATHGFVTTLRAKELDPLLPKPSVAVYVSGLLIGGNRAGETTDMVPNGDAHVLENLVVLTQTEPCCFNCLVAKVEADLVDRNCHMCSGSVEVILQPSGSCPPETFCSCDESYCPAPLTPQPCAE
jgi:hypothetical protein